MNIYHLIGIFPFICVAVYAQLPQGAPSGPKPIQRKPKAAQESAKIEHKEQAPCHFPKECVPLEVCAVFKHFASNLTPKNADFLKSVTCGFSGSEPLICCPVVPIEPDKVKCGDGGTAITRVVGGADAALADWPWAVAIFVDDEEGNADLSCGGTLINQHYILTAAHCVVSQSLGGKQIPASKFSVRIGDLNLDDDNDGAFPIIRRVTKATAHPSFKLSTFHNDIALLKLDSTVGYTSQIKPICFPDERDVGKNFEKGGAVLVGWGTIGFEKEAAPHLQYLQLPVQPQDVCVKAYARFRATHPIIPTQLCAGILTGKKDACQGDSGGPLVVFDQERDAWLLAGVVSYGLKCAEPGFPGIYTRVTSFLDWVQENIDPTTTVHQ